MTTFSKLLSQFIEAKGVTVYTLSKMTDIERSLIQKMKAGTRLTSKRRDIDALSAALALTPAENARFIDAYYRAQMGEELYQQRRLVRSILTGFYTQEKNSTYMEGSVNIEVHLENHWALLKGRPQVNRLLKAILEIEAAKKEGRIRLLTQPSFQFLYDTIATMNLARNHTRVENILCFDKDQEDGHFYNLETFRRLVLILYVQETFVPYYIYEYVSSLFNDTALYPYVILTSDFAMHVSYDTKQAVVYNCPDMIAAMNEIFEKKLSRASPLFRSLNAAPEEYFYNIAPLMDWKADNLNVMYQPCLIPFCPPEVVQKAINPAILEGNQDMVSEIASYFSAMRAYAPHLVQNFTMKGLRDFMDKGYVTEIPRFMMNGPLPEAARLLILREFIRRIREDHVPAHIIDTSLFPLPPQMMLTAYSPTCVILHYYRKDGHIFLLSPKEKDLIAAFQDFLTWIPGSHLVADGEKTLAMLTAVYKEYAEKFHRPLPLE